MKNSKITRLMLGLVILFSFFIFQGSDDHHSGGCLDNCAGDKSGYLTITNHYTTALPIRVNISGTESFTAYITHDAKKQFRLNSGRYTVTAITTPPIGEGQLISSQSVVMRDEEQQFITIY